MERSLSFDELTPYQVAVAIDQSGCGIGMLFVRRSDVPKFASEVWKGVISPTGAQETLVNRLERIAESGSDTRIDGNYFKRSRDPEEVLSCFIRKHNISPEQLRSWLWKNAEVEVPNGDLLKMIAYYLRNPPRKVLNLQYTNQIRSDVKTAKEDEMAHVLNFNQIEMRELTGDCSANARYLARLFTYLMNGKSNLKIWSKYLGQNNFNFCHTMTDKSVVGVDIGTDTIFCSLVNYHSLPMCSSKKYLGNGRYTYIVSTVEDQIYLDLAEMNPDEFGTRHSFILSAVFHRSPDAIVVAAGEIYSKFNEQNVYDSEIFFNMSSGTVMIDTFDYALPRGTGLTSVSFIEKELENPVYKMFWEPAVAYILREIYHGKIIITTDTFPAPVMTDEYIKGLCGLREFSDKIYEYNDQMTCGRDSRRQKSTGKFCNRRVVNGHFHI